MNIEELLKKAQETYDEAFDMRKNGKYDREMFKSAAEQFLKVLAVESDNRDALYYLAESYYWMKDDAKLAEAKKIYEQLLEMNPYDAGVLQSLAEVYYCRMDDKETGEKYFHLAIANDTDDKLDEWYPSYMLGCLYQDSEKYALAAAWLKKSLNEVDDKNTWDIQERFKICRKKMNIEELLKKAKNTYDKAFEMMQKGNHDLNMFKAAAKQFLMVLDLESNNWDALHGLADSYYWMEDDVTLVESKKIYEQLLEINPHDARAFFSLGEVYYYRLNNKEAGEKYFCLAIAYNTDDTFDEWYAAYSLGSIYQDSKKYFVAASWYKKSLDAIGDNRELSDEWEIEKRLELCLKKSKF